MIIEDWAFGILNNNENREIRMKGEEKKIGKIWKKIWKLRISTKIENINHIKIGQQFTCACQGEME